MAENFWIRRLAEARLSRRRVLAGAGAAGAGMALAGCGSRGSSSGAKSTGQAPTGTAKHGGTLTSFRMNPPSEDLEPFGTRSESTDAQIPLFENIFSGLIRVKLGQPYKYADRTLEGELAVKWEQPDPTTLTFSLRPSVKFHNKPPVNGRAVTADDVKFSYERLLGSPFSYVNLFNSIQSIQAPDPQTVVMQTKTPDATLLQHIALGMAWITAKEAGQPDPKGAGGLSFKDPSTAIGTGPFMLDKYQSGVTETMVRNPDYFESGLPYADRIEVQILPDKATQVAALRTGKAILGTIPAGSEQDLKSTSPSFGYSLFYNPSAWFHGMRIDQAPYSDVRVRRAMAMAYNQANVNKVLDTPDAPLTFGSVTANCGDAWLPLDKLGDNAQWWKYDPNAAKQLLAAAGFPNGLEVKLTVSNCCENSTLPELFAADMAKVGIKVNINVQPHPEYQASTVRGQYDGMTGSQFPIWDADDWISNLLPGSPRNVSHVDDPTIKDLQAKERAELDTAKRMDIIHETVKYLAGQVYQITHPQAVSTDANQPFVKNYAPRVGYQPTYMVTWLDKA
ncbi:MAG TPA: ABC transporter substrate-binding protein [Dehalococcoidia bacterium]|nr:ABC transporter substrate-binding protein [Dehalococcoidia bacterium]